MLDKVILRILLMVLIICTGLSITLGAFFSLKPSLTIELQRRFYRKINWNIEPISMSKEIRNTRIMGVFLIAVALAALFYIFKLVS